MKVGFGHIRLVEDDGHLGQIVDAERRRETDGVAEHDAVRALLEKRKENTNQDESISLIFHSIVLIRKVSARIAVFTGSIV